MTSLHIRTGLSTLAVLLACSAFGGLQEREQDVKKRSAKKKKSEREDSNSGHSHAATAPFGSGSYPSTESDYSGSFASDFWSWLVLAPFAYRHDDPAGAMTAEEEGWADEPYSLYPQHELGQTTAPYFRADYNFQWADGVDAHDGRIEAGYKLVAFHGRMTQFRLDVRQYYAVLRYGGARPDFVPGTFEVNFGVGVATHTGDIEEDDSSGALTFGLKYYPVDWMGVEFRPAWYRWEEILIRDYDLSVAAGYRHLMLRGGYRWLWDEGVVDVQSGFYAGASISF